MSNDREKLEREARDFWDAWFAEQKEAHEKGTYSSVAFAAAFAEKVLARGKKNGGKANGHT